jgi:hypothetical protein
MEETGVLENPDSVTRLLPAFEPGRQVQVEVIPWINAWMHRLEGQKQAGIAFFGPDDS